MISWRLVWCLYHTSRGIHWFPSCSYYPFRWLPFHKNLWVIGFLPGWPYIPALSSPRSSSSLLEFGNITRCQQQGAILQKAPLITVVLFTPSIHPWWIGSQHKTRILSCLESITRPCYIEPAEDDYSVYLHFIKVTFSSFSSLGG